MTLYERIYEVIRHIPRGRVATYGQIARILGVCGPRAVGYALNSSKDPTLPWHRVVNSKGRSSLGPEGAQLQLELLKLEGVTVDQRGAIDLSFFLWEGPTYEWMRERLVGEGTSGRASEDR